MNTNEKQNDSKIKQSKENKKADSKAVNYMVKLPRKDRKENLIVKMPPRPFTKD